MIETRANGKILRTLKQLREFEMDLGKAFQKVAQRHAVEDEVHFGAHALVERVSPAPPG